MEKMNIRANRVRKASRSRERYLSRVVWIRRFARIQTSKNTKRDRLIRFCRSMNPNALKIYRTFKLDNDTCRVIGGVAGVGQKMNRG